MTNVLLHRSYKSRDAGSIIDVPEREANGLVTLGLGEILKEEEPAAPKKVGKSADAE
ncbi:hypothetical protein HJB86_14555 [Rhizobium sp. NZLR3b]|uniref:hypothetical protein n=1 Tax=Rhizobium sp. NZLR3b TaxID=2731101 RepID=UPI001C8353AB|nr:hypothetical protein [Rhizobium sp. NZLR3b]MBX5190128.1 hypothetical protein [Rhizobium sp. NZLR3b]